VIYKGFDKDLIKNKPFITHVSKTGNIFYLAVPKILVECGYLEYTKEKELVKARVDKKKRYRVWFEEIED